MPRLLVSISNLNAKRGIVIKYFWSAQHNPTKTQPDARLLNHRTDGPDMSTRSALLIAKAQLQSDLPKRFVK